MNEEELNEAIEYNSKYMEAMLSEEIFGGDYTSSVELEYANKEIEKLQQENQQLEERIDKAKVKISALMSRYFYEEDFYIEDTDLDKVLQILDKGECNE